MDWLFIIVNELRHIFAVLIAEFLLVLPAMEKRDKFALRISLCAVFCCIISPVYGIFYVYMHSHMIAISIIWYTLIVICTGAVLAVCFKIKFTSLLWVMIAAYAVEHFVYVLVNEIVFTGLVGYDMFDWQETDYFWLMLLSNVVVCAGVYCCFYRIFRNNIKYLGKYFLSDSWRNRIFFCGFFALFFASTLLNQQNAQSSDAGINYLSAISDIINCLFVIIVQFIGLTTARSNFEKQMSDKLFEDEKRQYETFKNSVDYVNIKYHDLKHELQRIQGGGKMSTERLEEIVEGVAIYEAFAKTGNETLDILFTDKTLTCISKGISFSYMADAAELGIMDASDVYSMFGNLLDNAIEYVQNIEDRGKRFIRLFIKPQGAMLLIHEENYLESEVKLVDGVPQTSKDDKLYHGFGIKSMQRTARKYGGDLKINSEGNLFKIDLFIQIK